MSDDRTPITAETFAAGLRESYLLCRELGHLWRPHAASYDRHSHTYDRVLRCSRCRCERVQVMTELGHIVANAYRYPDGYLSKNIERGTYSRDVFRIESVHRYILKGTTEQ